MEEKDSQSQQGSESDNALAKYMAFGIPFGMLAGVVIGTLADSLAIWLSLGISFGVLGGVIAFSLRKDARDKRIK